MVLTSIIVKLYIKRPHEVLIFCIMALSLEEQFRKLIEESENCLVVIPKQYRVDNIVSALALGRFLSSLNKKYDLVCDDIGFKNFYKFLNGVEEFSQNLTLSNKLLIQIDISDINIKDIAHKKQDNFLKIYITPEEGKLKTDNIKFEAQDYNYDLIIVLGSSDLNSLGSVFTENTELFYSIPIINVDHQPENEHFGKINIVDLGSISVSEVLYTLFMEIDQDFIQEDIATLLLYGIVDKTRGYRFSVSPRCLQISADLVRRKAEKDLVIQNLYKNRSIEVLKLWGQILTNLQKDSSSQIFYTYINNIVKDRFNSNQIADVIFELLASIPQAKVILLSYPLDLDNKNYQHIVWSNLNYDSKNLTKEFLPKGNSEVVFFEKQGSLKDIQKEIIAYIRKQMNLEG